MFGVDATFAKTIDWTLAISRVMSDIRSDFILAPHLSCVFADSPDMLVDEVKGLLSAGKFTPQLPITIDIPKKQRINKASGIKRQSPNFVRTGGILMPPDRLVYQVLADVAQPLIEKKLNRKICFSHQPAGAKHLSRMFKTSRECWTEMQATLKGLETAAGASIVLRGDVASCFQSINQHTLVNMLDAAGFPKPLTKPLESMLVQMSTSRSSRGILQGLYPSDLLGNFYLYPLDRYLADSHIPSVRYVDDIYAFFKNHEESDRHIISIFRELRLLDLQFNESKTRVMTPGGLQTSDPDLDAMFGAAIEEIEAGLKEDDYEEIATDYGFQTIWHEQQPEIDESTIAIEATVKLFDESAKYPDSVEEIERFCLPLFAAFDSDYALDHVLGKLESEASMSQIYFNYLSNFLEEAKVESKILDVIAARKLRFDWEYIWAIACVIKMTKVSDDGVAALLSLAKDTSEESVCALAVIAAVKHGDYDRQKGVVAAIEKDASPYIRGAVLFAARYMHKALRKNVLDLLENQSSLYGMIANSTKKQPVK